jgi:glycine/D-amino acid oxidase-like deaminating enzyme
VPFWANVWERGQRWFLQAGQYEYTPDHRPLIGPAGSIGPEGLWLNGGYSGHGVMASAGGARLLIDLVTWRSTAADGALGPSNPEENPFRVDRGQTDRKHDVL